MPNNHANLAAALNATVPWQVDGKGRVRLNCDGPITAVNTRASKAVCTVYIPDGEDSYYDFIAGFTGGAEYFLDDNLSIGIEFQLNSSFSDEYSFRFGNPDKMNMNTASAVTLSIYW